MPDFSYLNRENIREEARKYFERDFSQYERGTEEYNRHFDAYRHTYGSAVLTREFSDIVANSLGQINELRPNNSEASKNQDLWNNKVGRNIGSDNPSNDEIADRIKNAFDNDELIIDHFDTRKYEEFVDLSQINNNLLNLTINTDQNQDFRPSSDPTQVGNAIDGGDYFIESDIDVLNGDGVQNTTPMGILTDQYRPGNSELSDQIDFVDRLSLNLDRLQGNQQDSYNHNQNPDQFDIPDFELFNPMAEIANQASNARNFLNIDPVILDLNGDNKIELISYQDSQVVFDVDNDNKVERTGWISGDEGFLVHDIDGDGKINDITETVSEYYNPNGDWDADSDGKYSKHGLAALAKLDGNGDGVFDENDEFFDKLQIWQDKNENGVTEQGELSTLQEAGIKDFDLAQIFDIEKERNEGNVILAQTSFTTIYGQSRITQAVDFTTNPIGYEFNDVNLGKLATSQDGTKTLAVTGDQGEIVDAANENVLNIFGGLGDDTIIGDAQNNMISGGKGSDTLKGGDGDDILIIDEQDKQENIDGGAGRDIAIINSDESVSLNLTKAGIETVVGGNGDDVLVGGGSANVFIDGGNGDDIIIGGAADDALSGSDGNDYIDGGFGDDVIRGHRGNDVLIGGQGGDLIDGGLNDDKLFGGDGKDILIGGKGSDEIDGGDKYDLAKYSGDYADYEIYKDGDAIKVKHRKNGDIDTLKNIEAIRFDNVTIKIEENSAPLSVADKILVDGDLAEFFIAKNELLKNDIDLEKHDLDIKSIENAVGGVAKIVKNGEGEITGVKFTPDESYSGVMSFDYSVVDENGAYATIIRHNNDGTSQEADHRSRVQFKLSDDPTDPLYYDQWYLSEINIKGAWRDYSGQGITIGVFEEGDFNRNHQDLDDNIVDSHKKDQEFRQIDNFSQHKTTVAGVIAAENNDYGILGVAHGAKLDGYSWDADETGLANLKNVDIANNSWGNAIKFGDNFSDPDNPNKIYEDFLKESVEEGRDGLGTINIFAGGNERQEGGNVNYHNLQNSRFAITTGSINQEGDLGALIEASTPFSNPGSAILVSAPGSNIKSTGNLLENDNGSEFLGEFSSSQGTSFSAPIISGIVALMLEANGDLGYRDVQKILALSAKKFDDPNTIWLENGANNVNGGSMHYSNDYGFGIVDAKAAVRLAESWQENNNYFNEESFVAQKDINGQLKDNDTSNVNFEISKSNMHNIENVEVFVDILHDDISELQLVLTSPSGTKTILMDNPQGEKAYEGGVKFNFSSRHFFGEKVDGKWNLEIIDNKSGNVGILKSWELKFYGKLDDGKDDLYVYTNEIKDVEGSRLIIKDEDGGNDTINATAVDGDNILDLNAGKVSRLNGQEIAISDSEKGEEYYQRLDDLEKKQLELVDLELALGQKNALVVTKEQELSETLTNIEQKVAQYNEKNSQLQSAIKTFNEAKVWFDEYTHVFTLDGSLVFQRADGHIVSLSRSSYDAKVNDYNSKLNKARNLESQVNKIVEDYNNLLAKRNALPDEIETLKNEIEDQGDALSQLEKDIEFDQNYIDEFENNNSTIIENAYLGDGNDKIIGNDQDNKLMAGRGENELTGGLGRDIFAIKSGAKQDLITDFTKGEDKIDLSDFKNINLSDLKITQVENDAIIEISAEQKIILQNFDSKLLDSSDFKFGDLFLGEGDDELSGFSNLNVFSGKGNDIIEANQGKNSIYGQDGDDILSGGSGNDYLDGGQGDDILNSSAGYDIAVGGQGKDNFVINRIPNSIIDIRDFDEDNDVIDLTKINSSPYDKIKDFVNLDIKQDGDDVVIDLFATGQVLSGGDFYDLNIDQKIIIRNKNIDQIKAKNFIGISDVASSKENLVISGQSGDIVTGLGNDIIDGYYFGDNNIYSGGGDDIITINRTGNYIETGSGNDIIRFRDSFFNGNDVIGDFDVDNDKIDFLGSHLKGSKLSDLGIIQDGNDVILQNLSRSFFSSRTITLKNVKIEQITAQNFIGLSDATDGDDFIYTNNYDNVIDSLAGDDYIEAGDGNDKLYGGSGSNTITGGNGADKFIISTDNNGVDTITDFNQEQGDKISFETYFKDLVIEQKGDDVLIYSNENSVTAKILLKDFDAGKISQNDFENLKQNTTPKITLPPQITQNSLSFSIDLGSYVVDDQADEELFFTVKSKDGGILPSYLKFKQASKILYFSPIYGPEEFSSSLILEVFDGQNVSRQEFMLLYDQGLVNNIKIPSNKKTIISTIFKDIIYGNSKNNIINLVADGKFDGDKFEAGDSEVLGALGSLISQTTTTLESLTKLTTSTIFGDIDLRSLNFFGDKIDGNKGKNSINFGNDSDAVIINNETNLAIKNIDRIKLGSGDDVVIIDDSLAKDSYNIMAQTGDDIIITGDSKDRIWGQMGDDKISTGGGNDFIEAGFGDDVVIGGSGHDKIFGGDGDDILSAESGFNIIKGGNGNDIITGGVNTDKIYGQDGDDIISGGAGQDYISLGDGNNIAYGGGSNDKIYGGKDNDVIDGGDGNDYINGYDGDNDIRGGKGRDKIYTANGNDIIDGGQGRDYIISGSGNDTVHGGSEHDIIRLGDGNDSAYGDSGNDNIIGQDGNDTIYGDDGKDYLDGGNGNDIINGGNDHDKIKGQDGDDILTGGFGKDHLFGGNGNDHFNYEFLEDSSINATDIIEDFEQGSDVINLSQIEEGLSFESFEFSVENGHTIIKDKNSDFAIDLKGQFELDEGDFIWG